RRSARTRGRIRTAARRRRILSRGCGPTSSGRPSAGSTTPTATRTCSAPARRWKTTKADLFFRTRVDQTKKDEPAARLFLMRGRGCAGRFKLPRARRTPASRPCVTRLPTKNPPDPVRGKLPPPLGLQASGRRKPGLSPRLWSDLRFARAPKVRRIRMAHQGASGRSDDPAHGAHRNQAGSVPREGRHLGFAEHDLTPVGATVRRKEVVAGSDGDKHLSRPDGVDQVPLG